MKLNKTRQQARRWRAGGRLKEAVETPSPKVVGEEACSRPGGVGGRRIKGDGVGNPSPQINSGSMS